MAVTNAAPSTAATATAATIRPWREPIERASSTTVRLLRDSDRRHENLAGVGGTLLGQQPGLRSMERYREVRANHRRRRVAGREVDRRRRVDRDDRHLCLARGEDDLDCRSN